MSVRNWVVAMMAAVSMIGLQSCLDDDNNYQKAFPNMLVTVKPQTDGSFFLQLDDKTTLKPTNIAVSPYGDKEVRALAFGEFVNEPSGMYTKSVLIHWMDSILTKPMAANLGTHDNDSIYGTDPVEIVNDFVTIAEDGYLTLRFSCLRGIINRPHFVNLISTNNPENPYEVEFRHHAFGDNSGVLSDGLVAFKLDSLPDTKGETVNLRLKWKSFEGVKTADFKYCSRQSTPGNNEMAKDKGTLRLF